MLAINFRRPASVKSSVIGLTCQRTRPAKIIGCKHMSYDLQWRDDLGGHLRSSSHVLCQWDIVKQIIVKSRTCSGFSQKGNCRVGRCYARFSDYLDVRSGF